MNSAITSGLSSAEAELRLLQDGPNTLPSAHRPFTTRVRHQMTQVVDSYRARFKLATTKGSTGRLGSVF